MNAKFGFYEIVRVSSQRQEVKEVDSFDGAVLGRARNDKGEWGYAVYVLALDETWNLNEAELTSTGRFMKREDFYDGESVRVVVDLQTGEGKFSAQRQEDTNANTKQVVRAEVHFFATEAGGRVSATPADKFGCLFVFEDELFDCRLFLDDVGSIEPGETKEVNIGFLSPELITSRLKPDTLFHLRDGKVIAYGVVLEILTTEG